MIRTVSHLFVVFIVLTLVACGGSGGGSTSAGSQDSGDAFPNDPPEVSDSDGDGVSDSDDEFPENSNEWVDTDADGVGDNSDAFPEDPTESSDNDLDGVGNNADAFPDDPTETVDSDGDGFGDNYDELPLDPSALADMDGDGLADDNDPDADGNGQADVLQNIVTSKQEFSVEMGSLIEFSVLGRDAKGQTLEGSDQGDWYIHYTVYEGRDSSREVFYDHHGDFGYGEYDEIKKRWDVKFPSPSKEGEYRILLSLYCTGEGAECYETVLDSNTVDIFFDITCSDESCNDRPDELPGIQVTDSAEANFVEKLITKPNGEIVALFTRNLENSFVLMFSESDDNGITWTKPIAIADDIYGDYQISSSDDNQLLILGHCDNLCVNVQDQSGEWSRTEIGLLSELHGCSDSSCTGFGGRDLIREEETYILAYAFQSNVYIIKSFDLVNWSDPVAVVANELGEAPVHSVDIMRAEDGTYWLVGFSGAGEVSTLTSNDADIWSRRKTFAKSPSNAGSIHLQEHEGAAVLTSTYFGDLTLQYLEGEDARMIVDLGEAPVPVAYNTVLKNGQVGTVFSQYINGQVDVFFIAQEVDEIVHAF